MYQGHRVHFTFLTFHDISLSSKEFLELKMVITCFCCCYVVAAAKAAPATQQS